MQLKDLTNGVINKLRKVQTMPITLGGDPEFFVMNKRRKVINADKFFPSKTNPCKIKTCTQHILYNGYRSHVSKLFFDGIQAEMAPEFSTCREYFILNISDIWKVVFKKIGPDHSVLLKPSVRVAKDILDIADPEARRFGCMPDFNAYTLSTNTAPMDASRHPFRYAGGHIHLGASFSVREGGIEAAKKEKKTCRSKYTIRELAMLENPEEHINIIKLLDLLLGIPTLVLDNMVGSNRRRAKYGKAGCFRPTPYGIEYRTLSCWWLASPITVSLVYGLARLAWNSLVTYPKALSYFYKVLKIDEDSVKGILDEGDVGEAEKLWSKLRPYILVLTNKQSNPLHELAFRLHPAIKHSFYPRTHTSSATLKDQPIEKKLTLEPDQAKKFWIQRPVFGIAVFEYIRKHGIYSIIDQNIRKEWDYNALHTGALTPGFLNGSYSKLGNNSDFLKFQKSCLNEL